MTRVLGVDGCPQGWVAVAPDADRARVYAAATLEQVIDAASMDGAVVCVGVDIPIGLAEDGVREADVLARRRLGRRGASLFMTPVRAALEATDYASALARQRAVTGGGFSKQAYHLREKVLAVRDFARRPGLELLEVHPELSFTVLAGAPMVHGKKTWAGAQERLAWLAREGIVLDADLGPDPGRAGVDDVIDAGAAAWTARRRVSGRAVSLPDPPQPLGDVACAIWA